MDKFESQFFLNIGHTTVKERKFDFLSIKGDNSNKKYCWEQMLQLESTESPNYKIVRNQIETRRLAIKETIEMKYEKTDPDGDEFPYSLFGASQAIAKSRQIAAARNARANASRAIEWYNLCRSKV